MNQCYRRYPYRRPRGTLMTEEAMKYGTPCDTEKRTVVDPQGLAHQVVFLEQDDDEAAEA